MRPKRAYLEQKRHAEERDIPWHFTYEDWLEMWLLSGRWEQRGKTKGCYQMCRKGDEGAYSTRNCYIGTVEENQKERHNISDEETAAIVWTWKNTEFPQWKIGKLFGLSQSAISRIVRGERRVGT